MQKVLNSSLRVNHHWFASELCHFEVERITEYKTSIKINILEIISCIFFIPHSFEIHIFLLFYIFSKIVSMNSFGNIKVSEYPVD